MITALIIFLAICWTIGEFTRTNGYARQKERRQHLQDEAVEKFLNE